MTQRHLSPALVALLMVAPAAAQQPMSADEKQIRDLIAAFDSGKPLPQTADRIFWTGAYRRPVVGDERPEEVTSGRQPSARVPGSQRNRATVRRVEVAKSGDLAYEFTDTELSFDLKDGKRESFPTSTLRVWRKEAGQWKVAAQFARPHQ